MPKKAGEEKGSYTRKKMRLTEQELAKIRSYFQEQPVLKAYLFGSFVRGEADEESDIDLLIDLDYSQHIGLNFFGMHQDLEEILNRKVDVVPSDGVRSYVKTTIEKEKQLIYVKG